MATLNHKDSRPVASQSQATPANTTAAHLPLAWINRRDPFVANILDQNAKAGGLLSREQEEAFTAQRNRSLDEGILSVFLDDLQLDRDEKSWAFKNGYEAATLLGARFMPSSNEIDDLDGLVSLLFRMCDMAYSLGFDYAETIATDALESVSNPTPAGFSAAEIEAIAVSDHDCPSVHRNS